MVTSGKTIRSEESRFACSIAFRIRATLPSKSPLVVLIWPIVTRIYDNILSLLLEEISFGGGLPPTWSGTSRIAAMNVKHGYSCEFVVSAFLFQQSDRTTNLHECV